MAEEGAAPENAKMALYLDNLPWNHHYLDLYNRQKSLVVVGQGAWEEDLLASTREMDRIFHNLDVPAWVDYWGYDVAHDWPWWRRQLPYFMEKVVPLND